MRSRRIGGVNIHVRHECRASAVTAASHILLRQTVANWRKKLNETTAMAAVRVLRRALGLDARSRQSLVGYTALVTGGTKVSTNVPCSTLCSLVRLS